ncbi:ImmA/IrrE family metallo-endopeptidase, partial [Butyrivibrio sp.]|uniref:ImmA/IrrE family metallo-endopeptidase n=1 Tax=Butyrivibrio sp. TaxID=28121 RepID=UPI0025C07C6D
MNNIILTPREIIEIKQLAKDMRAAFGVNDEVPIANDIKMFLDKQGILLCEYPFQENSKIDAEIVRFETDNKPLIFIGLNSSLYYDEQIFALAHEIYHFKTETGKAYNIDKNTEDDRIEKRADRFAAELLLPEGVLRSYVILEFGQDGIESNNILGILRFIAGIQLTWWLPYKSIVLRLREEGLI